MVEANIESILNEKGVDLYLDKIKTKVLSEIDRNKVGIPYMSKGRQFSDKGSTDPGWWTNGFFAGSLWQLYSYFRIEEFKNQAIKNEEILDQVFDYFYRVDHDAGFMWLHTSVANYKYTGNEVARLRGFKAASALTSRFNINGSYIRAWNREEAVGWAIIDSMMNIPLLFWASEEFLDPRFKTIAIKHADTLQRHLIRPDGSSGHIAAFDSNTGEFRELLAGQGYSSDSSWSRGQGWSIYGYALTYKHTKDIKYLETAKRAANYFLSNVLQTNYIPRIDFRAPTIDLDTDTSAGLIAACGMLEISKYIPDEEKNMYIDGSKKIVQTILENYCNFDESVDGIVYGGAVGYREGDERDVALIYADYFLIEYLLKIKNKELDLW
jgi:unsaturated chondroitin disaccharide hydrolase